MSSKSKSKQEEALQFLDDLNSLTPTSQPSRKAPNSAVPGAGEAEALAFLEEITQKSTEPIRTSTTHLERPISRSGTPTLRKSTERVKLGGASPLLPATSSSSISRANSAGPEQSAKPQEAQPAGGWGWGSVWSSASAAIQQAKSVVDEQVKALPVNEQARKWGEGVITYAKTAQLDKLSQDFRRVGLSTLTDILNVVAPPISEHEVIHVWLTHDMRGYEGVESLTYRALARIMEQVQGGDLVVNRGEESRPKDVAKGERDLNAVDGYEAALKMAQANIEELIKKKAEAPALKPSSLEAPTTYSHVYLRVQPFFTSHQVPSPPLSDSDSSSQLQSQDSLQFLLLLTDPVHKLNHTTVTQIIPTAWLDIWDQYEWVEDSVAEVIRVGVEVLGQQYVVARMGWIKAKEPKEAEEEEEEEDEDEEEEEEEDEEEDVSEAGKNK